MTYIDIVILFIILVSCGFGLYKGFVREVLGLTALVLAFVIAFYSYSSGYPQVWLPVGTTDYSFSIFDINIGGYDVAATVIFVLVFLLVLLLGRLLSNFLGQMVSASPLNLFNRLLGGGFGLLRGTVIIIALIMLAGITRLPYSDWWYDSRMLPSFVKGAQYAIGFLPPEYVQHFEFGAQDETMPSKEEFEL